MVELPIKSILSYSRIDLFKQCPMKYKFKYIDKNYSNVTSIALDLGTLCHYGMELKYKGHDVKDIWNGIENGFKEDEKIKSLNKIKEEYGFDFYEENEKSGLNYQDKMNVYKDKLFNEPIDPEWETIGTEVNFEITFNEKAKIMGFIDRVDKHRETGEIRVIDYKTNNKVFDKKDLATPLQMYIYSLACIELYGQEPVECIYDLLFLDEKQIGGTKGYMNRGFKALNKVLDTMIFSLDLGEEAYVPKPTPLCYWCDYCVNNPNSDPFFNDLCEYYSLWTRERKNFNVNKKWGE